MARKAGLTTLTEVETSQLPVPMVLDSFTRVSSCDILDGQSVQLICIGRLYNKIWRMSSPYKSASLSTRSASSGQRTDSVPRSACSSRIVHGKHQLFLLLHRSGCPPSRRSPHDDLSSVWLRNWP